MLALAFAAPLSAEILAQQLPGFYQQLKAEQQFSAAWRPDSTQSIQQWRTEVRQLLRDALPPRAIAARYGGEEFLAVLPDCSAAQAERIVDEIRQQFSAICFSAGDREFNVTLSAGIAGAPGLSDEQRDTLTSTIRTMAESDTWNKELDGFSEVSTA